MTLTLMPVFFSNAPAATLTAFVSAGPELPISAVSSVAWGLAGDPDATVAATAAAKTVTDRNARRFQWSFKVIPSCPSKGRSPCGTRREPLSQPPPWIDLAFGQQTYTLRAESLQSREKGAAPSVNRRHR